MGNHNSDPEIPFYLCGLDSFPPTFLNKRVLAYDDINVQLCFSLYAVCACFFSVFFFARSVTSICYDNVKTISLRVMFV